MRDCEVSHVRALLQFMYVGQVNIAQAQLSAFLRTADALQIRGLTDCSQHNDKVRVFDSTDRCSENIILGYA